jgi:hypothetical protein
MEMTQYRRVVASLLALVVAAACGDAAKAPITKSNSPSASAKGSKGIATDAVRHAAFNTKAARSAGGTKGVYEITLGQTVDGTLGPDEMSTEDGQHTDAWVLDLDAETEIAVTMVSDQIDAYLDVDEVVAWDEEDGAELEHLADDDDSAGGLDAGLQGTLSPGTYVINATTFEPGQVGSYTLSVVAVDGDSRLSEGVRAVTADIRSGSTHSGALTADDAIMDDGTHYQLVRYRGNGGERVTARLASTDFDAYLMVGIGSGGWDDLEVIAQNDDAGTSLDSEISLDLPEDGIYTFVVNTAFEGATGSYTLQVEARAPDYGRFSAGSTDPDGKYALVVGINDYPGNGSDLVGPTQDADLVARTLIDDYGFAPDNVIMLKDGDATRANIANGIVRHLGKAGPDGVAVFFYSGHGTRVGGNVGYLDDEADGEDDGLYVYGYGEGSTVLLDEELGYLFDQLEGQTFAAIDACFSGTISRAPGGQAKRAEMDDPDVAENIRLSKTFIAEELGGGYGFGFSESAMANLFSHPERNVVLSSSSEEQVSWTVGDWPDGSPPASLFTYFLVKEMRNADASTSFRDLLTRVDEQVDQYVQDSGGRFEDQDTQLVGPNLDRSIRSFLKGN